MNAKSIFILTAAILVTAALTVGLSAAQPADAKKATVYCVERPTDPSESECSRTLEQCEHLRTLISENYGITPGPCYEKKVKVSKDPEEG